MRRKSHGGGRFHCVRSAPENRRPFNERSLAASGADTRITLTGGEPILLIGLTATNITAGDLLFA